MLCTSSANYILGWTLFLSQLSSYEDQLGVLGDIPPGARTSFLPFTNVHINIDAVTALVPYMPIINVCLYFLITLYDILMLHGRQWLGGDIMVAWRAWVIWSRSKAVMTVLMFPLLLTTGKKLVLISAFYILIAWTRPVAAAVIVASTTKAQLRYVSEDRLTPAWAIRDIRIAHYGSIAVWTCSLLTNVVSTGLIGIKMWYVYCLVNYCYNLIDTTLRSTHDSLFFTGFIVLYFATISRTSPFAPSHSQFCLCSSSRESYTV